MRTVAVQSSPMNLAELIELARHDFVILRHTDETLFALIRLDEGDLEALSLSQNHEFMGMLDKVRARYDARGGISLEQVKRRFSRRRTAPAKRKKSVSRVRK